VPRTRNYAAEYQRRNERSKAKFGVSYNELRTLQNRGRDAGLTPTQVRKTLAEVRSKGLPPKLTTRHLIDEKARARSEYARGKPVDWDPFTACINTDEDGDICGHDPEDHHPPQPKTGDMPCKLCSCPDYIAPEWDDIEIPDEMFYYH
jgi:hypothetical protein